MSEFQRPHYTYRATLAKVVDGDTIDVYINVGFYTAMRKRLRFLDVDTEELRSSDASRRELAKEAKARVEELLNDATKLYVQTKMDSTGKYGRLLAYVWYMGEDGVAHNLNHQLLDEGFQKAPKIVE
jgi:micrococcal nuclease